MKRTISIIAILALIFTFSITGRIFAANLTTATMEVDKTKVKPGEEVKVTVKFGEELKAYTVDVKYDTKIFDYVPKAEAGDEEITDDKSEKVTVKLDESKSKNKSSFDLTFKAKADITTSNPTQFTATATASTLKNATDTTYDAFDSDLVKEVTVEPDYIDYDIKLEHTGDIKAGEEKEMTLSYSSAMGRYYEKARLVADATSPKDADVRLLATDEAGKEYDIIESGWGDQNGSKIGGKDVNQTLKVRAIFSHEGEYTIKLKLIDRSSADATIAEKDVKFTVGKKTETKDPAKDTDKDTDKEDPADEEDPEELPDTGINMDIVIIAILTALLSSYIYYYKKQ